MMMINSGLTLDLTQKHVLAAQHTTRIDARKSPLAKLYQHTAFRFHQRTTAAKDLVWNIMNADQDSPTKREGHSATYVPEINSIVLFGGCFLDIACYDDVYVFDLDTRKWSIPDITGSVTPGPRGGHVAVAIDNKIYVYGGYAHDRYLADVFTLDVKEWKWTKPSMGGADVKPRQGHAATVYDDQVFIFGGYGDNGYVDEVIVLDTQLNAWIEPAIKGENPGARAGHSATAIGHRMFVFGGMSDAGTFNDIYVLDLRLLAWMKLDTMGGTPPRVQEHSSFEYAGDLFVFGGCNYRDQECYNDLYRLKLHGPISESLVWEKLDDIDNNKVKKREGHSLTNIDGEVFMFGGCFLSRECYFDTLSLEDSKAENHDSKDKPKKHKKKKKKNSSHKKSHHKDEKHDDLKDGVNGDEATTKKDKTATTSSPKKTKSATPSTEKASVSPVQEKLKDSVELTEDSSTASGNSGTAAANENVEDSSTEKQSSDDGQTGTGAQVNFRQTVASTQQAQTGMVRLNTITVVVLVVGLLSIPMIILSVVWCRNRHKQAQSQPLLKAFHVEQD